MAADNLVSIYVAVPNRVMEGGEGASGYTDFYAMVLAQSDTVENVIDAARCGAAGSFCLKKVYEGASASQVNIKDFSRTQVWADTVNKLALMSTEIIGESVGGRCYIMMPRESAEAALADRPSS